MVMDYKGMRERQESRVKNVPKDFGLNWNMQLPFTEFENNEEREVFGEKIRHLVLNMLSLRYLQW